MSSLIILGAWRFSVISPSTRSRWPGATFLASPNRALTSRCCFFSRAVAFIRPSSRSIHETLIWIAGRHTPALPGVIPDRAERIVFGGGGADGAEGGTGGLSTVKQFCDQPTHPRAAERNPGIP